MKVAISNCKENVQAAIESSLVVDPILCDKYKTGASPETARVDGFLEIV